MIRRLWVITPVYLDVPSFLMLRARLLDVLAGNAGTAQLDARFVVADDTAGMDPDIDHLAACDDVTVIEPPFNLGHQRAIVYALRRVAAQIDDEDLVVTMDADGEDKPEDVPRLIVELQATASKRVIVLALRTKRSESLVFRAGYVLFRWSFRLLTGGVVRSGNFAAYRGLTARRVLAHPNFDLAYASTLTSLDLPLRGKECERGTRYAGQSRMSFTKLVRHGVSMLMPYIDRIAIRALIAFSCVIAACFALGVAVVAIRLGSDSAVPGWATSTLLALLVSSLVAVGNFVVLFSVYSQSRGLSLSDIELEDHGSTRNPSQAPDRTLS